jgi:hypothetical protein
MILQILFAGPKRTGRDVVGWRPPHRQKTLGVEEPEFRQAQESAPGAAMHTQR